MDKFIDEARAGMIKAHAKVLRVKDSDQPVENLADILWWLAYATQYISLAIETIERKNPTCQKSLSGTRSS